MDRTSDTAALDITGLSHAFGSSTVLDDVGLRIAQGEFVVLLGPNGAGKTTLISLITRLYANTTGRICILDHDINLSTARAMKNLGVVFQARTLDLDLTPDQNMIYHASLHGIGRSQALGRTQDELERAGLAEKRTAKVRQLSGGQMRRLEIARALLHKPSLLVLDEPTAGLDITARQGLLERVHELCINDDLAVLWATHLIDEVAPQDRVIVLHKGRVRADANEEELASQNGAQSLRECYLQLTGPDTDRLINEC